MGKYTAKYTAHKANILIDGRAAFSIYPLGISASRPIAEWRSKGEELAAEVAAALNPQRIIHTASYIEPECGGAFTLVGSTEAVRVGLLQAHECWLSNHCDDDDERQEAEMPHEWDTRQIVEHLKSHGWTVDLDRHQINISTLSAATE